MRLEPPQKRRTVDVREGIQQRGHVQSHRFLQPVTTERTVGQPLMRMLMAGRQQTLKLMHITPERTWLSAQADLGAGTCNEVNGGQALTQVGQRLAQIGQRRLLALF